ncbi:MAG: hypothetical protein D6826_07990 [Alphaproteobacteria bacterium]|nr:MAG: hypothetical protein D6826_07990 [Alphaproteobacteria bacterium]
MTCGRGSTVFGSLTRRFAVFGGLFVAGTCILIAVLAWHMVRADMREEAESSNIDLGRAFANVVWPRYAYFLHNAHNRSPEDLRAHARTAALRHDMLSMLDGLSVLKVKIYDRNGLSVFSTQTQEIGEKEKYSASFRQALEGQIVSTLFYNEVPGLGGRDILATCIPLRRNGQVVAVLELYKDVTEPLARLRRSQSIVVSTVMGTLLALYLALIAVVWRSEKQIHAQHEENVRLMREKAAAEEASRLKSAFMANMSHELRTPLNAVLGYAEILDTQLYGPIGTAKYLDCAHNIQSSGRYLLAIIDDILDMARLESGELTLEEEDVSLVEVIEASIAMIQVQAEGTGIELVADVPADLPRVRADRRRLIQALLNLLSNAVKFSTAGQQVHIRAARTPAGGVEICVIDEGIGIAPKDIARVLSPFGRVEGPYARKFEGTGLGLPIAKALIEMHGGILDLQSTRGCGTTARIELPAERIEDTDAPASEDEPSAASAA